MFIELFGHLANVIYVVALLIKDVLWMRLVLVAGAILELVYSLSVSAGVLWVNVFWSSVWIAVNGIQLTLLFMDRRTLDFSDDELRVYSLCFSNVAKVDFARMLRIAEWSTFTPGEEILGKGFINDRLFVICSGVAELEREDHCVTYLKDGNFIGEMSYITGNVTSASVIARTSVRVIYWDTSVLRTLLDKNPQLTSELTSAFSVDLVKKLSVKGFTRS